MNEKFYKWLMMIILIVIGILQFFEQSDRYNYILLLLALLAGVKYVKLRIDKKD